MTATAIDAIEIQREVAGLRASGFAVCKLLPSEKNPGYKRWTAYSLESDDFDAEDAVGIMTGPLSDAGHVGHALVCVDLDDAEANRLADDVLPETGMIEGRPSKPRSHRYYLVPFATIPTWAVSEAAEAAPACAAAKGHAGPFLKHFKAENGANILDFLGTGGQAASVPSRHPSGERRAWDGGERGEPAVVDFGKLWDAVCELAVACGAKVPTIPTPTAGPRKPFTLVASSDRESQARAYLAKVPASVSGSGGHSAAMWAARTMALGFDLGADAAYRLLSNGFNDRCQPPWSEKELLRKCQQADTLPFSKLRGWLLERNSHAPAGHNGQVYETTAESGDESEPQPETDSKEPSALNLLNDTGNVERFAQRYHDRLLHCWLWRKWLVWDGRRWRVDEKGRAEKAARMAIKRDLGEATEELAALSKQAGEDPDDEESKALIAKAKKRVGFLLASLDRRRIDALLAFARSELPVSHDDLNRHPMLMNCPNGTLDLKTGQLHPHRREDFLTTLCPTDYRPDAPRETFSRFLMMVLPSDGLRRFVRQLFGLGLIGSVHEHILPIFWGGGRNGKTTLIEAICSTVGTDFADSIVPDLLLARKGDNNHPTEIAFLYGKRILSAAETKEGKWLNSAAVKRLTGGDKLTGRRLREDFWSFTPSHTIFLLTNEKPRVEGQDLAIWSRLKLVPFTATFYKPNELPLGTDPTYLADTTMPAKLAAEAEGILAWMVDGCLDYLRNGLIVPPEVEQATGAYRGESDTVSRFLEECTKPMPGAGVKAGDAYARFMAWMKASGEESHLTMTAFGKRMEVLGIRKEKSNCVWYRDISLAFEATAEQ